MNIDEHAAIAAAFKRSFGADLDAPGWAWCKEQDYAAVLCAILRVEKNPMTRLYSRSLIAGKVMQAAAAKNKRSRLVGRKR